jgi:hypothetical protein
MAAERRISAVIRCSVAALVTACVLGGESVTPKNHRSAVESGAGSRFDDSIALPEGTGSVSSWCQQTH